MSWGYPGYIWLGVGLALLVLGGSVWAWFHRERVLGLFVSRERVSELSSLMPTWEYWLRAGLIGVGQRGAASTHQVNPLESARLVKDV